MDREHILGRQSTNYVATFLVEIQTLDLLVKIQILDLLVEIQILDLLIKIQILDIVVKIQILDLLVKIQILVLILSDMKDQLIAKRMYCFTNVLVKLCQLQGSDSIAFDDMLWLTLHI